VSFAPACSPSALSTSSRETFFTAHATSIAGTPMGADHTEHSGGASPAWMSARSQHARSPVSPLG